MTLKRALVSLTLVMLATTVGWGQVITLESLLREMVDMERLAVIPEPYYDSDQQSSYDRASTAPNKEGWFANGDAGQFIREEDHNGRKEWVMAEMDGPGVICRIWSANPDGGGNVRIYLDDMETPVIEEDFLKLTSGTMAEFPGPFSGRRSLGANLYLPLPYQTRAKCTVDKPSLYYQIGYRTYPKGTQVEPFSPAALANVKATMDEVGERLSNPSRRFTTDGADRTAEEWVLSPGQSETLRLTGERAIVRMEARVEDAAADEKRRELEERRARYTEMHPRVQTAVSELGKLEEGGAQERLFAALRESLLTVRFDGENEPCVWAPLGDFFGSQPGINAYESLPVGMREDGLCYANWHMPFGKQAEITVTNESASPVRLRLAVWAKPVAFDGGRDLYFHAKWRNEWLPSEPQFLDWRMLDGTGPGRFVGVMLGVMNTQSGW
ncbi:MAG: DUF2961 domain-containing protein, partial [Armatimonadetes bacterium]|nr:DUF2961 domain-containing protein [Armatimonadota bacterium]